MWLTPLATSNRRHIPASGALPRPLSLFRVRTWYPCGRIPYLLGCGHVCHFWPGKEHRPAGSSGCGSAISAQSPRTSGVCSLHLLIVSPPDIKTPHGGSCREIDSFFFLKVEGDEKVLTKVERWQLSKPKLRTATPTRSIMKKLTWSKRRTGTEICCWILPGRNSRGRYVWKRVTPVPTCVITQRLVHALKHYILVTGTVLFLLDVESAVVLHSVKFKTLLCMKFGICALSFLTSGTSAAMEAVWADILGGGTFSVLSFSYPRLPCVDYLNIVLPSSYIQYTYVLK